MEKAAISGTVQAWKPLCDAAPLGLGGFALTTFMLSAHNAGWAPDIVWITMAIFYGGATQFIAGMIEFSRNQVFGATVFGTYGAFWLALAFYFLLDLLPGSQFYTPPSPAILTSLGWFISGFFIFNTVFLVVATQTSIAVFSVIFLLEWTFLCLMVGYFRGEDAGLGPATTAGGYFGFFCSVAAFYTSFALIFNAMAEREIIPLGAPLLNFRQAAAPPPGGASYSAVEPPAVTSS